MTLHEMAEEVEISHDSCETILTEFGKELCLNQASFTCTDTKSKSWSLPQRISRPATNFWSTGRAKQVIANQPGPQQHQRPLGRAPLATEDKDTDHITLVSQSELLLP